MPYQLHQLTPAVGDPGKLARVAAAERVQGRRVHLGREELPNTLQSGALPVFNYLVRLPAQ